MYPVLFEFGGITVYSYGMMIAIGAAAGVWYLAVRGKQAVGLTFDQANMLFLIIFFAAVIGGKVFLFFEDPSGYLASPSRLFRGSGFVFYGSFLFAVPSMIYYFRKNKLDTFKMLDIMAITTCLVHVFGRLGCFLAGCCYGKPTDVAWGVTFVDPACSAKPLGTPLHPSQLYESLFILCVMIFLFTRRNKTAFDGQLFLLYLILYAIGRFFLELFRGDDVRGFIFDSFLSHSQLIALAILATSLVIYVKWSKRRSTPAKAL